MKKRQSRLCSYVLTAALTLGSIFTTALTDTTLADEIERNAAILNATASLNVYVIRSDARDMLNGEGRVAMQGDYAEDSLNYWRTHDTWLYNSNNERVDIMSGSRAALTYDYGLEKAAVQRAAELIKNFEHTRPDGRSAVTVLSDMGYSYSSYGENIARGQTSAAKVLDDWKEEDQPYSGQGHRRNMLSEDFKYIGIAHIRYENIDYWVQEFSDTATGANPTDPDDGDEIIDIGEPDPTPDPTPDPSGGGDE